jgi:hypothetical protein
LRIREILWSLYGNFSVYRTWLREDPDLIYPQVVGTLEFADHQTQFSWGQSTFHIVYKEQPASGTYEERTAPGAFMPDDIVRGTLGLMVDGQRVFKFEWCKRTEYHDSGPLFDERLGEITRLMGDLGLPNLLSFCRRLRPTRKAFGISATRQEGRENSKP